MKSKKLAIGLLVMLALVVTTGTFAFWASGISGNNNSATGTVNVGTGEAVTTTVNVSAQSGGVLVPSGRATTGQVETVTLTFPVTWVEDGTNNSFDGNSATLAASISNIQINGSATYASLVNTSISNPGSITLDGSAVNVEITVTLTEPSNQTEYDAVAGQAITFDVTFTVTVTP